MPAGKAEPFSGGALPAVERSGEDRGKRKFRHERERIIIYLSLKPEEEINFMGMKRYETFDHTADIGIRVFGRSVEEVFINAAFALFDLLTDLDSIRANLIREVVVEGADREDLLVRWLSELLFLCEGEGFLFREFSISSLTGTSLRAVARGEFFDPSRHRFKTEIKAVTYHQIEVAPQGGIWEGRVIFDV